MTGLDLNRRQNSTYKNYNSGDETPCRMLDITSFHLISKHLCTGIFLMSLRKCHSTFQQLWQWGK